MTHDPFQNYQTQGAYSGGATPFGQPYTPFQPLQGVGIAGQLGLLQQLLALNPLAAASLQNPLLAASLQHPLAQGQWQNPLLANQGWPQPQQQFQQPQFQGWPQQQSQFGYPLAPQSLIGAGGIGQPMGQIHPLLAQLLAQAGLRPSTSYGMSPLAGGF